MLREMDWEASVEGLEAHKLKYGIMVHKVNKKPYDKLIYNEDETWIKHVENTNNIPITNIAPLL
jgi:hypothetical protein